MGNLFPNDPILCISCIGFYRVVFVHCCTIAAALTTGMILLSYLLELVLWTELHQICHVRDKILLDLY